jgi:hypothetical protein
MLNEGMNAVIGTSMLCPRRAVDGEMTEQPTEAFLFSFSLLSD